MAQWNHSERTLYAKLVYYGPALGGKTTNLKTIHRLADPDGKEKLVSLNTSDDRTLFFDLLPIDMGNLLGYKVVIKLYTVPGQVKYDATRRIVLSGSDAVVFVADSNPARERDNRDSWENLRLNMRANRLDPASVSVLVQFNKRDVPGAADIGAMERWFGLAAGRGIPAVAPGGDGVLETFLAASRAMLERLVALSETTSRRSLNAGDLGAQIERAFAPYFARRRAQDDRAGPAPTAAASSPIVVVSPDLLENAVQTTLTLGSQLADEHSRASRLEAEAEALRRLSDGLRSAGARFDRASVVDAVLEAAGATLGAVSVALMTFDGESRARAERTRGRSVDPLLGSDAGAELLARMLAADGVTVIDDLAQELPPSATKVAAGVRAVATVAVSWVNRAALFVAMPAPDGRLLESDVRFLTTLAGHLAVGLDKVRIHAELASHRDRLEEIVHARTEALRRAYEDLKAAHQVKDRFLTNVSHEMLTPLTAILGASSFLKECEVEPREREQMAGTILDGARDLEKQLEALLRVARVGRADETALGVVSADELVAQALQLAGEDGIRVTIDPRVGPFPADPLRLALAVANLADNARKFGSSTESVEIRVKPCTLEQPGGTLAGVAVSVLDRGPGIREEEVSRAFEPFEQGGDILTGKPAGIGLGLYEAREIARQHGGTLVYLPRPEGGAEFRLSLPAEAAVPAVVGS